MAWWEALILGIVQGLTEFLPVSSSGHLLMMKELLGVEQQGGVTFEVMVHAATVLSTIIVFRKDIWKLLAGFFKFKYNAETEYLLKIGLSMIPVLIVGLFFKDFVASLFGEGLGLVGSMLLITALLLTLTHFVKFKERHSIRYKDAFIIGLAQACAVLPGLSRSGTTIATGLLLGDRKEEIARFSFLMVLIPILGEAFLELIGGEFAPAASGIPVTSLLIGFFAAFLSGLFACKLMLRIVKNSKLIYFAIYCAVAGLVAIGFSIFS
ncbi:undecaprenyl-diphosphate phosphatase [Bacteroidales bacterium OttesenSCG-928-J16]|nr:undecaprenyl-diphosphate phosphatase [Bacteroidales bacterium OttesenSCG-928-J16]